MFRSLSSSWASFVTTFIIISMVILPSLVFAQFEICDNGIDDDNDSLIDLNDDDCDCVVVEPISLIPNPSFEDMECCPSDRSQLDCATDWIQASEPTTDYINTCGWFGWEQFPPPTPIPDGNGIMGFRDGRVRGNNDGEPQWKEYAGACLTNPLLADSTYRFQFDVGFVNNQVSPPINISFFGTTDCVNLPFGVGNQAFGCPTNGPNWVKLGDVAVSGNNGNVWVNTFIETTPDEYIYAIAIGPDCTAVISPASLYYFFDNLILADIELFDLLISESTHPCNSDYNLSVPNNPEFEYQWYKEGIALVGETSSELTNNYGEGNYQVVIIDDESCRVSSEFEYAIPVFEEPITIAICEGESYLFNGENLTTSGMYLDTLKDENGCDIIVPLELEIIGEKTDTLDAIILEGENFEIGEYSFSEEGEYPLTFMSSQGCDSLVLLSLLNFKVYIPNVFSPNNDGINDTFRPFTADDIIRSVNMSIYDRWGNKVFQGMEWRSREFSPGVYAYLIDIEFTNDLSKQFVGTVTVLK